MFMERIKAHLLEAEEILKAFYSDDNNIRAVYDAGCLMIESIKNGGKIISCGNGGSLCDAMHFAEELSGKFRNDRPALPAIAISDASHMSCTANDFGYEYVFSRYVEALGRPGDVLLAISTSGNSLSVINAIEAAKKNQMQVVGLTGKGGGKMASLCDVEIRAPETKYSDRAQEIHIKVIHALLDNIELGLR
ncbi:MAG: D-sedoheptulose 7-phosphate isomerase [Bacteroidia bacterium]